METEPAQPDDSKPPESSTEEPVAPVPTSDTTPVWAQTRPVAPPDDDEAAAPVPIKKGDPDWAEPEASSNGDASDKTPEWAETVPTSPGEPAGESTPPQAEVAEVEEAAEAAEAAEPVEAVEPAETVEAEEPVEAAEPVEPVEPAEPVEAVEAVQAVEPVQPVEAEEPAPTITPTASAPPRAPDMWDDAATVPPPPSEPEATPAPLNVPPRAVAADAEKSTWPPRAEAAPAPPAETDIWPPEPPTEKAMPAWPPPSELEEPATPAQAIPSWPDSFGADSAHGAPTAPTPPAPAASPVPVAQTTPPTEPETIPPAPPTQPVAPAPSPVPPAQPAAPAARPSWAPGPAPVEPAAASTPHEHSTAYQVPAWAPRVPLAAEPGTPTWFSPKEQIPHPTNQPLVQPAQPKPPPAPAPPVEGGQLPVAPIAKAPEPAPGKAAWQVVEQRNAAKAPQGPTAEDRSYAEWFAWAKRGGAPASACHAAAQGAFKALSSGKDVNTAVQWATAAMSRPPENVSYARQTYCAWFALANIDLNLDQHRSHAFAGGAVQALDMGADASQAHAAGLAAAGIR